MEAKTRSEVWAWYKQFSHDPAAVYDRISENFLIRVDPAEIAKFKDEFGPVIPEVYERFLIEIGAGRLTEDITHKTTMSYYNCFPSPSDIAQILRRETVDWQIYPEFIDDDEIPCFELHNSAVLVFKKGEDAIYFPFGVTKFADSFDEFLFKLMSDCVFYTRRD